MYDQITSKLDLNELMQLREVENFDWIENYLAKKSQSRKDIIRSLIDYKISKEHKNEFASFGKRRKSRKNRKSKKRS